MTLITLGREWVNRLTPPPLHRSSCHKYIRFALLLVYPLSDRIYQDLLEAQLSIPDRPRPDPTQPRTHTVTQHSHFPEGVDAVPPTKA